MPAVCAVPAGSQSSGCCRIDSQADNVMRSKLIKASHFSETFFILLMAFEKPELLFSFLSFSAEKSVWKHMTPYYHFQRHEKIENMLKHDFSFYTSLTKT